MKATLGLSLCAVLVAGCASVAIKDEEIQKRTAFSLGADASAITISNRSNQGMRTEYTATTKKGKKYNCYMEGTMVIYGKVVSDAVCVEMSEDGPVGKAEASCNTLMKAAGKCK